MLYRTLHTYILRELLRVFFLTASALTTLMAFGGTFRPLTKQGIDVRELLWIVLYMMPPMLAYAIPIAALFAAVLVYWRMSTDNELTACRAGGISFVAIVLPAFVLGLAVSSVDMAFVNVVVPRFLQLTERAIRQDMGSLIVSQIGRQEKFQMEGLPGGMAMVVMANTAELEPSDNPNKSLVKLEGMAASTVDKQGRPIYIIVAQEAIIEIENLPKEDAADVTFEVRNFSAFDATKSEVKAGTNGDFDPTSAFTKISTSLDWAKMTGKPYHMTSLLRTKVKFLNLKDLRNLSLDPYSFPDVAKAYDKMKAAAENESIVQNAQALWQKNGQQLTFSHLQEIGRKDDQFTVTAAGVRVDAAASADRSLTFVGGVKIQQSSEGKVLATFTCDEADLLLAPDPLTQGVMAHLRLKGNIQLQNAVVQTPMHEEARTLSNLTMDPALLTVSGAGLPTLQEKMALTEQARQSPRESLRDLSVKVQEQIASLNQRLDSELHSRGSFSLSCLTLVLLGAALGILLRGQNPLAVFVVGFVPAVILVLLITAGRQLTEGDARNVTTGISLIWAGNVVLLLLVAGVYLKLLRR